MKPCAHLKKPSTNSVGNWSAEEDEAILRYVYSKEQTGDSMMWGNLQHSLNGRSGKSCRERWFNHLDPKIKRCDWTVEEQWVLFILRNQQNEKWSLISKILLGRTDNAVKNYWNSRLRKRIDNMQKAYEQHFERKKKQKILTYLEASGWNEQTNVQEKTKKINDKEDMSKQTLAELEKNLNEAQQKELKETMEKLKADYLHKMIEQIEKQNIEYYNELACEYELQMQKLKEVSGPSIFYNQAQIQNESNGGLDLNSPRFQDQSKEENRQYEFINEEQQFNQINHQSGQTLSNTNNGTVIQQDLNLISNSNQFDSNFSGLAQENSKLVQQQDLDRNKIGRFESFSSDQIDDAVDALEDVLPSEKLVTKERSPYKNNLIQKSDNLNLGVPECEEEDYESQLSQLYIFRSAATLKMHLEILYKSVGFLNRKQIMSELSKYKEGKEKEQMRLKEIRREQEDAVGRRRGRKKEVKDFDSSPYAGLKLGIRKGSASHEIYQSIDDDVAMEDDEDTESEEEESDEIEETAKRQIKQKQEFIHDYNKMKKMKKGEEIPDLTKISEKQKNKTILGMKKNVSFPNKKTINNIGSLNKFQDNEKGLEPNSLFDNQLKRSDILSRTKTGKTLATQTGISGDLVKTRSDNNFNSHEANGPTDALKHQREQEDIYLVLSGSDSDNSQNYKKTKNRQAGSGELKRTLNGLDNYDSDSSESLSSLRSKISKHSRLSCQTNQALKKIKKQKKKSKYIQKIFLTEKLQKNSLGKDPLIQTSKIQPINEQDKIYQISCYTPQPYRDMYPREYGQIQAFAGYANHNQVPVGNFQPQNTWASSVLNQQIQDKNNAYAIFQSQQQQQQLQMIPQDQRFEYPSPSLSTRMNELNLVTTQAGKNQGFVAHINQNTTNFIGGPNLQSVDLKNISSVSFGTNQVQNIQGSTNQNPIFINQERNHSPHDISYVFGSNVQKNLSGLSFNNSPYLQGQNNSKLAGFFSQQKIDSMVSGQFSQNIDNNEFIKSSKIQNERIISAKYTKIATNNSTKYKLSSNKKAIEKALARVNAQSSKHNTPQIGQAKQRVIMEGNTQSLFFQDNEDKINKDIGQDLDSRFMMKSKSARQIPFQSGFHENLWRTTNFQTLINEQKIPQETSKLDLQIGHASNIDSQFRVANFSSNAFQVRELSSNARVQTPLSGLNQVPQLQNFHSQNPIIVQRGNSLNQAWQGQVSSESGLSFPQNFSNINHAKQPTLDRQVQSMFAGPANPLLAYNANQLVNYGNFNQNGAPAIANLHPSQQYTQNNHYLGPQQSNQLMYQQQQVDYPYRNNVQIQYLNQGLGQGQQIQLIDQQNPFIRATHQIQSNIQTSATQGTTGFQSWMNTEKKRVLTHSGLPTDPNSKMDEQEANKLNTVGNSSLASIKDIRSVNPQGIDQQIGYYQSQPQSFQKVNQFQNISQVSELSFAQQQNMMLNNGSNPEMNLQQANQYNNTMYMNQQKDYQFGNNITQMGPNSTFTSGQHHIHQINIQPGLSIISNQDSQNQMYGQIQNQHNQQQQQIIGSSYDKNSIGVNRSASHEEASGSQSYKIGISGINKVKNENSHGLSDNINTRDQQDEHLIERIEETQNELSHAQGQNTFLSQDANSKAQAGKSQKRIFHTSNFLNSTIAQLSKMQSKNDNFRPSSISDRKQMYYSMTGGRRGQSQARQSKQLLASHQEINPDYNGMVSPDLTSGSDTRLSAQNYGRNGGSGGQDISNQMIPGINLNSAKKAFITPFQRLAEGRTSNF